LREALVTRSEKAKMLAGELYRADTPELVADRAATAEWLARVNTAPPGDAEALHAILKERLAEFGDNSAIRQPFYCDYGYNIRIGAGVFLNFGCVILDVMGVTIGAGTQIGPAVQIYAADHPRDPELRRAGLESGRPVHIGSNVWIGGGAIVLPGITIGDDAIVGAGSVVSRDVPARATVAGNPARPIAARRPAHKPR
jgi:maltose O-acetyltransferase